MFDIGFWELVLISVMGLVVLGPERLPGAIRSVMAVVRKVKSSVSSVTDELKQELELDELHRNLKKAEQQGLESLNGDLKDSFETLKARADSVNRPYSDKPPSTDASDSKAAASGSKTSQEDKS